MDVDKAAVAAGFVLRGGESFMFSYVVPEIETTHVQYVRVLLQFRNLDDMRGNAASYVAAMDVSGARSMISQSLDPT